MSTVTMIGFDAASGIEALYSSELKRLQFLPIVETSEIDPARDPAESFALSIDDKMSWWVAVKDSLIDLDRIYDLAKEMEDQAFAGLSTFLLRENGVQRVAFLFLDLGSDEIATESEHDLFLTLDRIQKRIALGGPLGSLIVWWCRNPSATPGNV